MALINMYGLPITIEAAGYLVLQEAMTEERFNAGVDIIISDEEVMEAIIAQAKVVSDKYKNLSEAFLKEFDIKCPENSSCLSGWDIFCNDFAITMECIGDTILDIADFAMNLSLTPLRGLTNMFSSNPLGSLMLFGLIGLAALIFIKFGLPILFPPAAAGGVS